MGSPVAEIALKLGRALDAGQMGRADLLAAMLGQAWVAENRGLIPFAAAVPLVAARATWAQAQHLAEIVLATIADSDPAQPESGAQSRGPYRQEGENLPLD